MPALPTNDLRSESKDYLRDANHKAKWARGAAPASGKKCDHVDAWSETACEECGVRPNHRDQSRRNGRHYSDLKNAWTKKQTNQKTTMARKAFRNEVSDASGGPFNGPLDGPLSGIISDSSGDEEVKDAAAAPVPDAGVMYSFDARRGPGAGSQILSHAINKAVQRFENKETEKLAKEYDFVHDGNEDEGHTADVDEDGFELI